IITTIRSSKIPLTDGILRHQWFANLRELCVSGNPRVTDLNHLTGLRVLDISGECGVGDAGIKGCHRLEKLNASDNPNVTDLNHLSCLRVLDISLECGVG